MPLVHVVLIIGLMAALGVASAFFSAMETALFSLQPRQIKKLREALPERQGTIDLLFANPRRLLSMILVGDTLTNLPLCLLGLYLLRTFSTWRASDAAERLADAGSVLVRDAERVPVLPAALGLYLLVVGVCDLLPKIIALRRPMSVAPASVRALHYLRPVFNPVCGALQALAERLADLLTPRQVSQPLQLTEAEFEALVEVGAEEGALRDAESEMIQEIIKLGDKTAKDCMTPRVEIFGLPGDLTNEQAVARLRAQRRRRVPVYGDTPDEILGILDTQKFLSRCADAQSAARAGQAGQAGGPGADAGAAAGLSTHAAAGSTSAAGGASTSAADLSSAAAGSSTVAAGGDTPPVAAAAADASEHYTEVMDPPSYVSETMRALDLLRSFVNRPQGLAVVVDEYGGTEGIVTLADITEEIVGDALPREQDELYIEQLDDDRLLAGGHARLDDISEFSGFELQAEGLDTISGLVFNRLGYLPKPGDVVRLRNLTLTIRRVTRTRITEVLLEKDDSVKPAAPGAAPGEGEDDVTAAGPEPTAAAASSTPASRAADRAATAELGS